jgi:hypothetical protein
MSDFGEMGLGGQDPGIGSNGEEIDPSADLSLANPFLAKIPQGDREVVAKYIKDWDSGVTKRFQQIHEQYRPYKELGADPEALQGAWAIQQMINEDPQRVYDLLGQVLGQGQGQQQAQEAQPQLTSSELEDLPPAFVEKFTRMEQILEQLAGQFMETQEQQQAKAEDEELDNYIGQLHEQFGDFDEDWVLQKMLKGMDGAQAVNAYNKWVQDTINSRMSGKRPVPVLNGGGSMPLNGVKPSELTRQQTQDMVAQMLANAAGEQ